MKRTAKWFTREVLKQVQCNPRIPVRFDIDIKDEDRSVQSALAELRRTGGQWDITCGEYPDKRDPKKKRVAFLGPDRPQPEKTMPIPPVRIDGTKVEKYTAQLEGDKPKKKTISPTADRSPTSPSMIYDRLPPKERARHWAKSEAMEEALSPYRQQYAPEYFVELSEPTPDQMKYPSSTISTNTGMDWLKKYPPEIFEKVCSGKKGGTQHSWCIRLWKGEDWIATKYAALYPAEIAYLLEDGERAKDVAARMEPDARRRHGIRKTNRRISSTPRENAGHQTYLKIINALREHKNKFPMNSHTVALFAVARKFDYRSPYKIAARIQRHEGISYKDYYEGLPRS